MEGIKNFRDLGGLPTQDGRKIKKGCFSRSAAWDFATTEDLESHKKLELVRVCDYRDATERHRSALKNYEKVGVKHGNYPTDITSGKLFKLNNSGWTRALIVIKDEDVQKFYIHLPFNNDGYREMVRALENGEVPFLQHCTAGKDRAGVGSALLEAILGVGYEDIVEDYLKSEEVRDYIRELMSKEIPVFLRKRLVKQYEPLFGVNRIYLDSVKNAIIDRYGSFEEYLLAEYGLTTEKVSELRNLYTE